MTDADADNTAGDEAIRGALAELNRCMASEVKKVLESLRGSAHDWAAFAAALLVSSLEPRDRKMRWFDAALKLLASSRSSAALAFLEHAAQNASIGAVRLEALKALKGHELTDEGAETVHAYAAEGLPEQEKLEVLDDKRPKPEHFQIAALGVLTSEAARTSESLDVVWRVLGDQLDAAVASQDIYDATLACLYEIAEPEMVRRCLETLESVTQPQLKLDVLAVIGPVDKKAIESDRERIREELLAGLQGCGNEYELRDGLLAVVRKLADAEFLQALVERFGSQHINTARGQVVAEGLAAYGQVDELLLEGVLAFASVSGNTRQKLTCYEAVRKCVSACPDRFLAEILTSDQPGFRDLRAKPRLSEFYADPHDLLSAGLTAIKEDLLSSEDGPKLLLSCMALTLPDIESRNKRSKMRRLARDMTQQNYELSKDIRARYVDVCDDYGLWDDWKPLVGMAIAPGAPANASSVLEPLFATADALSSRLLPVMLHEAGRFAQEHTGYPAEDSACCKLETYLAEHQADQLSKWIEEALFVRETGALRYALGLARRRNMKFLERAERLIVSNLAHDTMDLVIQELRRCGGPPSVRLLAQATCYSGERASVVRRSALDAIARTALDDPEAIYGVCGDCSPAIHDRFHDGREVRRAAYKAAGAMSCFESIPELRRRRQNDKDKEADGLIGAALKRIAERLHRQQPAAGDPEALVEWLQRVAQLEDGSFFETVAGYLCPTPHHDRNVVLAALQCLPHVDGERGFEVCKEYIREASPGGELLRAANHALAVIHGRQDLTLLENLPWLVGDASKLCDPQAHNYVDLLGSVRAGVIADQLKKCRSRFEKREWDSLVCGLDGIAHVLLKQVYESNWDSMGLPGGQDPAAYADRKDQAELLGRPGFKNTYPRLHAELDHLHNLRRQTDTAHLERKDRTPRPGIQDEATAREAKALLAKGFELAVHVLEEGSE